MPFCSGRCVACTLRLEYEAVHAPQIAAAGTSYVLVLYNSLYNVCMCVSVECVHCAGCCMVGGSGPLLLSAIMHVCQVLCICGYCRGLLGYGSAVVGLAGGLMSQLGTAAAAAIVLLFCVACVCVCEFLLWTHAHGMYSARVPAGHMLLVSFGCGQQSLLRFVAAAVSVHYWLKVQISLLQAAGTLPTGLLLL